MRLAFVISAATLCTIWVSCEKAIEEPTLLLKNTNAQMNIASTKFSYGEITFFLNSDPSKNTIHPVSIPKKAGYFKAIPNGLAIDETSGAIDLSQSLTGLAFKIFYVSNSGKLLDSTRIVVSGIDYEDGIYDLSKQREVQPFYNANKTIRITGIDSDFDETDLNGDGTDDVDGVFKKNLVINKKTGAIDLKKSIRNGLLGKRPLSGANGNFTFYYRVKDGSKKTLNKLEVRIVYYKKRNEVPSALTDILSTREKIDKRVNKMPTPGLSGETTDLGNGNTGDPLGELDAFGKPRRPPLVIIVE